MDLHLSFLFLLTISILGSFILDLTFEAKGTKMKLCKVLEEVPQEERE